MLKLIKKSSKVVVCPECQNSCSIGYIGKYKDKSKGKVYHCYACNYEFTVNGESK